LSNQRQSLYDQLRSLIGVEPEEELRLTGVPEVDLRDIAAMDLDDDTEEALDNSYSLRLLREQSRAAGGSEKQRLKLQITQTEATVTTAVSEAYAAVQAAMSQLTLAESQLAQSESNLQIAETSYAKGLISLVAVTAQRNDYHSKQAAAVNARNSLFWQLEAYKALLDGLAGGSAA
jgi:outer membrane protein TolC